MALVMFQNQIAKRFERGKRTTIREVAKPGVRPGAVVDLAVWTGKAYRSPTRRFATAKIRSVKPIEFTENECEIDGERLTQRKRKALAAADGFDTWGDFVEFFRRKKSDERVFFSGVIIEFEDYVQTGEI